MLRLVVLFLIAVVFHSSASGSITVQARSGSTWIPASGVTITGSDVQISRATGDYRIFTTWTQITPCSVHTTSNPRQVEVELGTITGSCSSPLFQHQKGYRVLPVTSGTNRLKCSGKTAATVPSVDSGAYILTVK